MDTNLLIIFGSIFATTIVLTLVLVSLLTGRRRQMQDRISVIRQRLGEEAPDVASRVSLMLDGDQKKNSLDKVALRYLPKPDELRQKLRRANLNISLGTYLCICLVVAVIGTCVMALVVKMPMAVAILSGIGSGLLLPHQFVSFKVASRKKAFIAAFPEAIDLIVRGVKSGLPVTEGISVVSHEMPDPIGTEFRRIAEAIKFGQTLDQALWDASRRLDIAEFQFFVISLVVQAETGGNLSESLGNLGDILRKRQQMKLKIKAMSSEAKSSAFILGGLPFLMTAILYAINPDYISLLFTDPRGMMMAVVGLISMSVGIAVMMKMVRFEI